MTDPASDEVLAPPYAPELVADLHAGALPADLADQLWPRAREDGDAAQLLSALDTTAAELRGLRDGDVEPMPEFVAARLRRTLIAEPTETTAPPVTGAGLDARPRRSSRLALAGAAAIVLGVGAYLGVSQFGPAATDRPSAMTTPSEAPDGTIDMPGGTVPPTAIHAVRNAAVVGRLADPELRSDCLTANGYDAGTTVLGAGQAKVGERLGTLLLIPGDRPPLLIALVVGDRCSASNPDLLALNTVTD